MLVLLGAMVVGGIVALDHHSGPTASSVAPSASKPALPQSHNACGDISRGQVTSAIGAPPPLLRVINSANAIDASWERAPQWSGCIWAGFDRNTDTGGGVQLAVARFPTPAEATSLYKKETTGTRRARENWRPVAGIGSKALFSLQSNGYAAAEIAVLEGHVAFGIEYVLGPKPRTKQQLLQTLKPLARSVLARVGR